MMIKYAWDHRECGQSMADHDHIPTLSHCHWQCVTLLPLAVTSACLPWAEADTGSVGL